jgi:hypothetical protein
LRKVAHNTPAASGCRRHQGQNQSTGGRESWKQHELWKTRQITGEMAIDATCAQRIVSLLKISTIEVGVATVNFSVPDEVKAEFDKTFGDQNKSSIIAELMRRAVRERHLQIRRERLFRQLSSARSRRPSFSSDEVRRARAANRP